MNIVLVAALGLPLLVGASADQTGTAFYLHDDAAARPVAPDPHAPTLVRYDDNPYPYVGAQPITWTFTPQTDMHVVGIGGAIWFQSDATHVERDLAPLLSAYELGVFQGEDPGLVHGAATASSHGDSDNPVFPPFTPDGAYRVDFPMRDADAHLIAGVPVEVRVLAWTTNHDHSWLANDGTFLHDMLQSDLAVLFGSPAHDSHVMLLTA